MKHLFAHRTRSSEWNYWNSGILVQMRSNQVSEPFCLTTRYFDHDCLFNRHLAHLFPNLCHLLSAVFQKRINFQGFSWLDEKWIALVILKVYCLMSNRCKDKDKIWVSLWETLNGKEDKDEDVFVRDIEIQSHLHGITLTTPAGTPAFSQIAAFDQIMRTL